MVLAWSPAGRAEELQYVEDFRAEAGESQTRGVPILVLFSTPGCSYCEQVREEFLLPTLRNAEYRDKVIIREIQVRSDRKLVDFSGKATSHRQFAKSQKVRLMPTVKLYDSQGRELTRPIIGLQNPDFYGGLLDEAIDKGLEKLRPIRAVKN